MSYRHTLTVSVADTEIEVEVAFTMSPFYPATGHECHDGPSPAEGGETEIQDATVWINKVQHKAPDCLLNIINNDDGLMETLSESAAESGIDDGDAARDRQRDEAA